MKKSVTYDANDIKKILAKMHGVEEKNVIKSQYSYTVILQDEGSEESK